METQLPPHFQIDPLRTEGAVAAQPRRYHGALVGAVLLITALFGALIWVGYSNARAQALVTAQNLSAVLGQNLKSILLRIESDLNVFAAEMTPDDMAGHISEDRRADINARMGFHLKAFDFVYSYRVFDAQGNSLFGAGGSNPSASFNVLDREWFQILKAQPDRKLVISDLMMGKATPIPVAVVAVPMRGPDQSLNGAVLAVLNLTALQGLADGLNLGKDGLVAIRNLESFKLLLRRPSLTDPIAEASQGAELARKQVSAVENGDGDFTSPVDHLYRRYAFRHLTPYPLNVLVAVAESDYLASWRVQSMWLVGIALLMIACVVVLYVLQSRVQSRLLRLYGSLKSSEQHLAVETAKLQSILKTASDGIHILDEQGCLVMASDSFFVMHGLSADTALGIHVADWNAEWNRDSLSERLARCLELGKTEQFETLHKRSDGTVFPVEIYTRGIELEGHSFLYCSARDISDRKRAERFLQDSEERFRSLVEETTDWIWETDQHHCLTVVERVTHGLDGVVIDGVLGKRRWDVASERQVDPLVWEQHLADLSDHRSFRDFRYWITAQNGQDMWLSISGSPFYDDGGTFQGYRGTGTNVTAEAEISAQLRLLSSLVEQSPVSAVIVNRDFSVHYANPETAKMSGYEVSELVGQSVWHWLRVGTLATIIQGVLDNKQPWSGEVATQRKTGEDIWLHLDITFIYDVFNRIKQYVFLASDISVRRKADEELRLAALVYDKSSQAMTVTDADGIIITVNPAFTALTGYGRDEVIGKPIRILQSGRQDEAFYRALWDGLNTTGHWHGEIWNRRKNGEIYPELLTINTVFNPDGQVHRRVALFSDITEQKQSQEAIWRHANFDALTGLPNRRMFHDRLNQEVKKSHRAGLKMALMFIDLDHFKEVNDTLGHDKGDILLQEAALRLTSCVRETDIVARLGGDEFTVLLGDLEDLGAVDRVADAIILKIAEPYQLEHDTAYISASIGITLYPEDAEDTEGLLKCADQAMYESKHLGRNRYNYFKAAMQEASLFRAKIASDLRQAIVEHQFQLFYQPIVNLKTGEIYKAEALIRWNHPTRGLVSPADFIPVAEETGLIVPIGEWVFHEAAEQVARWNMSQEINIQVSINKSPVQFRENTTHLTAWGDHLARLDLKGSSITVEITEGLLLDASDGINNQLLSFRDAGIQVSLDDFGTGYSSLSYLKKFDIDYLKIDQSFVRGLTPTSSDMALCEAIIVMAHKLDMKVIAEGIETEDQRDLLVKAKCDYGQGYLFSRPLPADGFEALLNKMNPAKHL